MLFQKPGFTPPSFLPRSAAGRDARTVLMTCSNTARSKAGLPVRQVLEKTANPLLRWKFHNVINGRVIYAIVVFIGFFRAALLCGLPLLLALCGLELDNRVAPHAQVDCGISALFPQSGGPRG